MISVCTPARPKILNPCLPPPPRQNTQRESSSSFMFHVYRPVIVDDDRYDTNSVERVRKKNKKQKKDIIENIALLPCGERNVHARVCVFPRRFRIFREHQHRRKISRENGHIYIYMYMCMCSVMYVLARNARIPLNSLAPNREHGIRRFARRKPARRRIFQKCFSSCRISGSFTVPRGSRTTADREKLKRSGHSRNRENLPCPCLARRDNYDREEFIGIRRLNSIRFNTNR